jgi:chromosome segregation ATPase
VSEGFEKFVDLENRIYRIIEVYKATRAQKEALEKECQKLKSQVEQLSLENEQMKRDLSDAGQERQLVKGKIETLLERLEQFNLAADTEPEVS